MGKPELRQKIIDHADKVEKEDPELAKKIRTHVDAIVTWYVVNKRDMAMDDFVEIIEGMKVKDAKPSNPLV